MCRSCKLPPVPDEDDIIECSRRVTAIVKVTILHKKIKKIDLQVKLIYYLTYFSQVLQLYRSQFIDL